MNNIIYSRLYRTDRRLVLDDTKTGPRYCYQRRPIGVVAGMNTPEGVFVAASICNPKDRFNLQQGLGICKTRIESAISGSPFVIRVPEKCRAEIERQLEAFKGRCQKYFLTPDVNEPEVC